MNHWLFAMFIVCCAFFSATLAHANEQHLLAPGDKLTLTVFGHADLSSELSVAPDSSITIPLLGTLDAKGLTVGMLRDIITEELNKEYVVDPKVTVQLAARAPFYILGYVEKPGSYEFTEGMTVLQAAAIAGGFTTRASRDKITITRKHDDGTTSTIEANENTVILPSDTIEIHRRWF